ncbi:unnamed protein product [Knipowitschia caucasica]
MSFLPETLSLQKLAREPYLALPTAPQCLATYVWVNASGTSVKSKTQTLPCEPQSIHDVPLFYGTHWFDEQTHEISLVPLRMFQDPFTLGINKLILCHALVLDGSAAPGNRRVVCLEAMEAVEDQKPWFCFKQQYLLQTLEGQPFGWDSADSPIKGVSSTVGLNNTFGRQVSLSHCNACLYAGVRITETTAGSIPAQWEFQVGPCAGVDLGDQVWMSRYILHRVCEDFGVVPSFRPKPVEHPIWANGGHMNFSTESMREEGGLRHIHAAIERLSQRHPEDMWMYGSEENMQRLNNVGPNPDFSTFSWAVSERKCSVRIPGHVHEAGRGYLEDRRPAADCDPYQVSMVLVQTCCRP